MRMVLVRHARAGHKHEWKAPDELRPLDAVGNRHANRLVPMLVETTAPVTRLISSPTVRCMQTLEPLSAALRRPILVDDDLGPAASPDRVLAMLEDRTYEGAVVCTHGEVLRPVLDVLVGRRSHRLGITVNRRRLLTKGSAWDITMANGTPIAFRHVDPTR